LKKVSNVCSGYVFCRRVSVFIVKLQIAGLDDVSDNGMRK